MNHFATTQQQYREIASFLTEEIGPEILLPRLPTTPNEAAQLGHLFGYWDKGCLKGAAFIRPLNQQAQAVIDNPAIEPGIAKDVQAWLLDQILIELIATSRDHRRQGIATRIVSELEAVFVYEGADVIITVAENEAAARLFYKAGYFVYKPNVNLVLTQNDSTYPKTLGILPATPDTYMALKKVTDSSRYTFYASHAYARNTQNNGLVLRPADFPALRVFYQDDFV